jgi:uncharacterized protein YigE (DUF2233 family)
VTGLSERAVCRKDHRISGRWGGLLLAIGALGAWPAVHAGGAAQWDALSPGLEIALWEPEERCQEVVPALVILRVDPERFRFATFHFRSEGLPEPITVQDWQQRTGASVVMNSGLFLEDFSYLGLLLKEGRSIGGKRHGSWQGLFVAEPAAPGFRKAGILDLSLDTFSEDQPAYREAAQALMLLDRTGKTRVRRTGKQAQQTLIGENGDGAILLIKTMSVVGLWELAECLRAGWPELRQAMALDGGSSSDLLLAPELARKLWGERAPESWQGLLDGSGQRHIPLPSVIGLFPRR